MMRASVAALVMASVLGSTVRADAPAPRPSGPASSLPPGFWFRDNHYEQGWLDRDLPTPTRAAIAGLFSDDEAATQAAQRVQQSAVDLGFPWVVENHNLRLRGQCGEAIVVVAGLFAAEAEAQAWRQADSSRGWLQIVPLAGNKDAHDCGWQERNGWDVDRLGKGIDVVHIDPTADAPGFPFTVRRDRLGDAHRDLKSSGPPVCKVPRGTVHSFRERNAIWEFPGFLPARCRGRLVFVPTEKTMHFILIERKTGETLLHQLTEVECDTPTFRTWRYTRSGRKPIAGVPTTVASGCGG